MSALAKYADTIHSRELSLMEDRNAAQFTTRPFCHVFREFWVHRLEERSNKGGFERRSHNGSLLPEIATYDAMSENQQIR